MANYAGVDWASEKHDVLVADAAGSSSHPGTAV